MSEFHNCLLCLQLVREEDVDVCAKFHSICRFGACSDYYDVKTCGLCEGEVEDGQFCKDGVEEAESRRALVATLQDWSANHKRLKTQSAPYEKMLDHLHELVELVDI